MWVVFYDKLSCFVSKLPKKRYLKSGGPKYFERMPVYVSLVSPELAHQTTSVKLPIFLDRTSWHSPH